MCKRISAGPPDLRFKPKPETSPTSSVSALNRTARLLGSGRIFQSAQRTRPALASCNLEGIWTKRAGRKIGNRLACQMGSLPSRIFESAFAWLQNRHRPQQTFPTAQPRDCHESNSPATCRSEKERVQSPSSPSARDLDKGKYFAPHPTQLLWLEQAPCRRHPRPRRAFRQPRERAGPATYNLVGAIL